MNGIKFFRKGHNFYRLALSFVILILLCVHESESRTRHSHGDQPRVLNERSQSETPVQGTQNEDDLLQQQSASGFDGYIPAFIGLPTFLTSRNNKDDKSEENVRSNTYPGDPDYNLPFDNFHPKYSRNERPRLSITTFTNSLDAVRQISDGSFEGIVRNNEDLQQHASFSRMRQKEENEPDNVFVCNISEHMKNCDYSQGPINGLENHINDLISEAIINLGSHVGSLKEDYHENYDVGDDFNSEKVHENYKVLDYGRNDNEDFEISEASILNKLHADMIKAACYLHETKKIANFVNGPDEQDYVSSLNKTLHERPYNFYSFLCNIRIWMDEINLAVSDVVTIEKTKAFEDVLPMHLRKKWDFSVLISVTEYLKTLQSELRTIKMMKELLNGN